MNKPNLRSRMRKFYWTHDWFRKSMNFFLIPRNFFVWWMALAIFLSFFSGKIVQSHQSSPIMDQYAKNYFEAADRASDCNETLRLRIQEHNGCEAALRKCKESNVQVP